MPPPRSSRCFPSMWAGAVWQMPLTPDKDSWAKEYAELKGLLSEDEYAAARSSTLNAHYTTPVP